MSDRVVRIGAAWIVLTCLFTQTAAAGSPPPPSQQKGPAAEIRRALTQGKPSPELKLPISMRLPAGTADRRATPRVWPQEGSAADGAWSMLTPPGRFAFHSAVWDNERSQMLVFGGKAATELHPVNALWAFQTSTRTWRPLTPSGTPPPPRVSHAAVFDPGNAQRPAQMLVFGGVCCSSDNLSVNSELWSYQPRNDAWVQLHPTGGPSARFLHTAVWDPGDVQREPQMLVLGGCCDQDGFVFDDLWSYRPSSNTWARLQTIGATLPPRFAHSAVWDNIQSQMIVFGGSDDLNLSNDVYGYQPSANRWTAFSPAGGLPPARAEHSAAWDSSGHRMLVFGGLSTTSSNLGDLWSYQPGGSWTQLSMAPSPTGRAGHTAVWNPLDNQMLLFGGQNELGPMADLWRFQAATGWSQVTPPGPVPQARLWHVAVWDTTRSQMLVFGGTALAGGAVTELGDLWRFSADSSWAGLDPPNPIPAARTFHAAVWDPIGDRMIVYGGLRSLSGNSQVMADLWSYEPGANRWTLLSPNGPAPPPFAAPQAVWDPVAERMLVVGMCVGCGGEVHLWSYLPPGPAPGSNTWTHLAALPTPPFGRILHSAVWDAEHGQLVVFGGLISGGSSGNIPVGDLWAYQPATNTWLQLIPGSTLHPPSYGHSAVWDAVGGGRVLVFGGGGLQVVSSDLWTYRPSGVQTGGVWAQLAPVGLVPGGRLSHTAVFDPVGGQMLVFAGFGGPDGVMDDVWSYRPAASPSTGSLRPRPTLSTPTPASVTPVPTQTSKVAPAFVPNAPSTRSINIGPRPRGVSTPSEAKGEKPRL